MPPLVRRYASHEVAALPQCRSERCQRYYVSRPAVGLPKGAYPSGAFPDRYWVEPTTTVARRVAWLNAMVDEGVSRDRALLDPLAVLCRQRSDGTSRGISQQILDLQNRMVAYVPDPDGEEVFQMARFSLLVRAGDCEDKSVFFSTVARLAGLEADVVWLDQPGAANNHVVSRVCLSRLDGREVPAPRAPWDDAGRWRLRVTAPESSASCGAWSWMETTLRGARAGEHPYDALARLGTQHDDRANL